MQEDGTIASFRREGDLPKSSCMIPSKAPRAAGGHTDKNMHDVTAYLVTLK